MHRSILTTIV